MVSIRWWLLGGKACGALLLFLAIWAPGQADEAEEEYPHLLLGNPSKATDDKGKKDNYLMKKKHFALSYNNSTGTPNWVSWRLTKDDMGDEPRRKFDADSSLPSGFTVIEHKDYTGSGYDRGHV